MPTTHVTDAPVINEAQLHQARSTARIAGAQSRHAPDVMSDQSKDHHLLPPSPHLLLRLLSWWQHLWRRVLYLC